MGGATSKKPSSPQQSLISLQSRGNFQIDVEAGQVRVVPRTPETSPAPKAEYLGTDLAWESLTDLAEIGHGNYGAVYSARFGQSRVAVKRLFFETKNTGRVVEGLRKEVSILEVSQHPNIVRFLGAVQTPPYLALVFDLCQCSLASFLKLVAKGQSQVSWDLLLNMAVQAAEALAYLHDSSPQILHRDIKAENLLLTADFDVRVTDFGLSRFLPESDEARHMTRCGSVLYVAPEVMRGEAYNSAVDVYSFAITLWEMFNLERPFKMHASSDIPYLVSENGLRPEFKAHMPAPLWDLIEQCWSAIPEVRPCFLQIVDQLKEIPTLFDATLPLVVLPCSDPSHLNTHCGQLGGGVHSLPKTMVAAF